MTFLDAALRSNKTLGVTPLQLSLVVLGMLRGPQRAKNNAGKSVTFLDAALRSPNALAAESGDAEDVAQPPESPQPPGSPQRAPREPQRAKPANMSPRFRGTGGEGKGVLNTRSGKAAKQTNTQNKTNSLPSAAAPVQKMSVFAVRKH